MSNATQYPPNLTQSQINQQQYQQQQKQYQQQQQQQYKQSLAQQQAEIRYYVYQDLQNLINLMYSRRAVLEQFKNEPNHPMITLSNNKLILQLNLSNTIHTDLNQQCTNNKELKKTLIEERQNAFGILKKVIDKEKEEQQKINNKQVNSLDPQLQHYKKQYENQKFDLNQLKLQETGLVAKFDEEVLGRIVFASQAVDSQIEGLRNGSTFNIPTEAEFIRKAENYYKLTQEKLTVNFQYGQKDQNGRQDLNSPQIQVGIEEENCQKTSSAKFQQSSTFPQNIKNQVDTTQSSKDELIKRLLYFGFFNQDREDHNCWRDVQKKFTKLKDILIRDKQKNLEISTAIEAYSNQPFFYDHYLLHYFFSLYNEIETQQQKQQNTSYIERFQQAQQEIQQDENLNFDFLKYLLQFKEQIIRPNNQFSQSTVTQNYGWKHSNKQEFNKPDLRSNGDPSRMEVFSEDNIYQLYQNFNQQQQHKK